MTLSAPTAQKHAGRIESLGAVSGAGLDPHPPRLTPGRDPHPEQEIFDLLLRTGPKRPAEMS